MAYSNTQLSINGKWRPSQSGKTIAVLNPATEEQIGTVAHADRADLDEALDAAAKGFKAWRAVAPFDRCKIMRKAAAIMRERNEEIAPLLTMEQGKTMLNDTMRQGKDALGEAQNKLGESYGHIKETVRDAAESALSTDGSGMDTEDDEQPSGSTSDQASGYGQTPSSTPRQTW